MANYIIFGDDGKEYGPVSGEQLCQWIADGRVHAGTQARDESAAEWTPLAGILEFHAALMSAPPPLSPAAAPAARPRTSRMAITSLVLGILGILTCGITALAGLVFGIVAMVKVKNSGGRLGGKGIALAGIIVSGIFLLMFILSMILLFTGMTQSFAGMTQPALASDKQKAQDINCVNNTKQLALAVKIYSGDNGGKYPPAATWCDAIKGTVGDDKVFKCPGTESSSRCGYAYNAKLGGMEESKIDPGTVMFFESDAGWNASGGPELMITKPRHSGVFVVGLADGSAMQLRESQLSTLRWNP
jgi:hypothetical protein